MGLLSFPSVVGDGILPVLIFHTIFSMALIKNLVVSLAQVVGAFNWASSLVETDQQDWDRPQEPESRRRSVSITQFKNLSPGSNINNNNNNNNNNNGIVVIIGHVEECCVCLCGYEGEEEVSELISCKHFFHRGCLDKWFDTNKNASCPICRSVF